MIEYCLRPLNENIFSTHDFDNMFDEYFTFDELHRRNVSAEQLISWSASIDLVEQYQHYVDQTDIFSPSNKVFYNCTEPWFGSRCQYTFGFRGTITLNDIIIATFESKSDHAVPHTVTNLTCYIHLQCDRGPPPMCLDWREVCDGRIDCLDG
ncbi:unnamed protein product, partial [Didymodactylos carnosus]